MKPFKHPGRLDWFKRFSTDADGATAIIMAFLIPLVLAGLAFGAEFGYFELAKRRLQNAADTGAYAAGTQKRSGLGQTEMEEAALLVAEEGGYDPATGTLTVYDPPIAPSAFAGDPDALNVALTQTLDRMFSQIFFADDTLTLAVNTTVRVTNGRPACILSLNPTMHDAVNIAGSTTVTMDGCDVAANSIADDAVSSGGGAAVLETDCVSSVGGVDDPGNVFVFNDCGAAIENAPITPDPYADVPEPDCAGSYDATSGFAPGAATTETEGCWSAPSTNLNITKDITLDPGVYVFRNINLTLTGGGSISGTDVTLYFEGTSSFQLTGNADLNIKAPTSGDLSGIAVFAERSSPIDIDLSGDNGAAVVGAIYAPNFGSDVTYIGNTAAFVAGECTQIIAGGRIEFTGDSEFSADCTGSGTSAILAAETIQIVE